MIINHIKVAIRYLNNHRSYLIINVIGLSLGYLCFLLLNAYVASERNFDTQHPNAFRLIQKEISDQGEVLNIATIGPRVGYAAKEQFPEIKAVTEIGSMGRMTVGNDPANLNYEQFFTVDSGFFEVFNFKFLEGSPDQLFHQPNGILLTQSLKEKYFSNQPALGQQLKTNVFDGVVGGVIEDFPGNTHFHANLMIPAQTSAEIFNWWNDFVSSNWHRNAFITYFKVQENANVVDLGNRITSLAANNWPEGEPFNSAFILQNVQDIHLHPEAVEGEINHAKGNLFYVNIFFWIALIILLVASFNYTGLLNMAFMSRTSEIGVRKAIGAGRRQLLGQFLVESLMLTSISLLVALMVLQLVRPFLPDIFGPAFDLSFIPYNRILLIAAIGLGISIISIVYPSYSIILTGIVKALKGPQPDYRIFSLRKLMIVFQFVAAITLIASTTFLFRQVNYLQEKELGFDLDGLVTVDINSGALRSKFVAIKDEFSKLPEVQNVSVSSRVPGEWKDFPFVDVVKAGQDLPQARQMIFVATDHDFISTYDLTLAQGNNFSGKDFDSTQVILNQSAVVALGLEQPIGQLLEIPQVNWSGDIAPLDEKLKVRVAGVVNDFHFEDFRETIKPMVLGFWRNPIQNIDYYTLRVSTSDWAGTLASLRQINDKFDAENPLEFHVLDDQFARFHQPVILRSKLLLFFAGVVIFIACLGLFATTAYTLQIRRKEIGIRKVLGARIIEIVSLVSNDFLRLVLVGAVIATPLTWFLMKRWMSEFAYHIPLHWQVFGFAGFVAVLIAVGTIAYQCIKAALENPVQAIRDE